MHCIALDNNRLINTGVVFVLRNDVGKWLNMSHKDLFTTLQHTCLNHNFMSPRFLFYDGPAKSLVLAKTVQKHENFRLS